MRLESRIRKRNGKKGKTHDAFLSGRGLRNSKINEPSNNEYGPAMVGSSLEANREALEVFVGAMKEIYPPEYSDLGFRSRDACPRQRIF